MQQAISTAARIGAAILLGVSFLTGGCASKAPFSDAKLAISGTSLNHRSLAVRTGSTPNFYADTPGRRTFGIFGVVAMMRSGNGLVEQYGLKDPAADVSNALAAMLVERNQMRPAAPSEADLVLDIQTINWDFRPYRNDKDNLHVTYSARVSLIDRRSGEVIGEGKCRSRRDTQSDSATLEQLLADGASLLQAEIAEAGRECVQRLRGDSLTALLYPSPTAVAAVAAGTVNGSAVALATGAPAAAVPVADVASVAR